MEEEINAEELFLVVADKTEVEVNLMAMVADTLPLSHELFNKHMVALNPHAKYAINLGMLPSSVGTVLIIYTEMMHPDLSQPTIPHPTPSLTPLSTLTQLLLTISPTT